MDMAHRWLIKAVAMPLGVAGLLAAGLTACSGSGSSTPCVDRFQHDFTKGYKVISNDKCDSQALGASYYYHPVVKNGWARGGTFTKPHDDTHYGTTHKHHSSTSGGSKTRKKRH